MCGSKPIQLGSLGNVTGLEAKVPLPVGGAHGIKGSKGENDEHYEHKAEDYGNLNPAYLGTSGPNLYSRVMSKTYRAADNGNYSPQDYSKVA